MTETPCQLYLISPLDVSGDFPARLERALDAGEGLVTAFQFRVKGLDQHEAAALAEPLQAICAAREVAFIVNDDVALAKRLKADGVHLGQGDGDPADAREELGREAQIGVTCHGSRHLALEAGEAGGRQDARSYELQVETRREAVPGSLIVTREKGQWLGPCVFEDQLRGGRGTSSP